MNPSDLIDNHQGANNFADSTVFFNHAYCLLLLCDDLVGFLQFLLQVLNGCQLILMDELTWRHGPEELQFLP